MTRKGRTTQYRRNNYCHKLHAKIGTGPLTVIYVDTKTILANGGGRMVPGYRVKFRKANSVYATLYTGIVAPEYVVGGTLFISLH